MNASEALRAMIMEEAEKADAPAPPPGVEARRLLDHFADHENKHSFKPGDLVRIKPGLRMNYRHPFGERPGVVLELFSSPIEADWERPSERGLMLDVRVGVLDKDGDFMAFAYPSAIFEPYDGPVETVTPAA